MPALAVAAAAAATSAEVASATAEALGALGSVIAGAAVGEPIFFEEAPADRPRKGYGDVADHRKS
jgi:hypothetical protein